MRLILFRCSPQDYFRLGKTSLENTYDMIHADTLFSALMNAHRLLYGNSATDAFARLWLEGMIRISSAFHCLEYGPGQLLYFLPLPLLFRTGSPDDIKAFKRLRYISAGLWEQPESFAGRIALGASHSISAQEARMLGLPSGVRSFPDVHLMQAPLYPKVRVHQQGDADAYFTTTRLEPQQIELTARRHAQAHFYCLLDHRMPPDSPETQRLMAAFRLAADEGIGGDRSIGGGLFRGTEELPAPAWMQKPAESGDAHICLSPTLPASEAEFEAFELYQLALRGGGTVGAWNSADRRRVRMIAEGAVQTRPVQGRIEDLRPPQRTAPLLRYGLNLTLPYRHAAR